MATKKKLKRKTGSSDTAWGLARISLGFVFLWAFVDKLIGLGFSTCRDAATDSVSVMCERAWLAGGSPTEGFLKFGTDGPFADFYQNLAGIAIIDWLFMVGLLGLGIALMLGIGMRIAAYTGVLLMVMMYTASLPPDTNPIISYHIIYAIMLVGLYRQNESQKLGFGSQWSRTDLVKKYPILK